jgi:hypothetical protein
MIHFHLWVPGTKLGSMTRRMFFLALIAALAAPLGGCGRKASPESPPGSDHPRRYPTQ